MNTEITSYLMAARKYAINARSTPYPPQAAWNARWAVRCVRIAAELAALEMDQ